MLDWIYSLMARSVIFQADGRRVMKNYQDTNYSSKSLRLLLRLLAYATLKFILEFEVLFLGFYEILLKCF